MRPSLLLAQLFTLAANSSAYNCNTHNFPLDGSWIPGQNVPNADITDKFIDANPEGMGSAHIWGSPGRLIPWERDENNLFTIHYCFSRDWNREHIGATVEAAIEERWSDIGRAGPRSGHGLTMKEVVDEDGNPVYCMDSTAEDK